MSFFYPKTRKDKNNTFFPNHYDHVLSMFEYAAQSYSLLFLKEMQVVLGISRNKARKCYDYAVCHATVTSSNSLQRGLHVHVQIIAQNILFSKSEREHGGKILSGYEI